MSVATNFPTSHLELAEIGKGELLRFSASFSEYWELLEEAEYTADFFQNEIIAMSYETNPHSKIVAVMLGLLMKIFEWPKFTVHTPNRPIYIESVGAVHNPDASVVREPSVLFEYRPGVNAETTPVVIVEALSKTTRQYDLNEKLPNYKRIPGLRQIIFIETTRPTVTVWTRKHDDEIWQKSDFTDLDSSFLIENQPVALREIYSRVTF